MSASDSTFRGNTLEKTLKFSDCCESIRNGINQVAFELQLQLCFFVCLVSWKLQVTNLEIQVSFFGLGLKCLGKELPPCKFICKSQKKNVCYNVLLDIWVEVFLESSHKK